MTINRVLDELLDDGWRGGSTDSPLRHLPDAEEFAALEEALRQSDLLNEAAAPHPRLGELCAVAAECLAEQINRRQVPFRVTLQPDECGSVLALALAVGWSPVGRLCKQEQFEELAARFGVPVGAAAEHPVVTTSRRTLCDVLAGFDVPGVESPFVDVFCVSDDPEEGAAVEAQEADEGPLERDIEEMIVVGRGIGPTRQRVQECCFAAGLCSGGLVTDGLIHLTKDNTERVTALLGQSGGAPGFLQMRASFGPRALNFILRELRDLSRTSRFVRFHEVPTSEVEKIRSRLAALAKAPPTQAVLLAPDEEVAAACLPVPRRGRGGLWVRVPLAVVESAFFREQVGAFEEVMLHRMAKNAEAREKFHAREVINDRAQLANFASMLQRFLNRLPQEQRDELVTSIDADKEFSDKVNAADGGELGRLLDQAVRQLTRGEKVDHDDVSTFSAVSSLIIPQVNAVLGNQAAVEEVKQMAQSIQDQLQEPHYLNMVVNHRRGTKSAMAKQRKTNGQEYLGRILPESVRLHLQWREEMKQLKEQINKAKGSRALRQWTGGVVLDLVLRNRPLDFGGPSAAGYEGFRQAVRPFLLRAYCDALKRFGMHSPDELCTANLIFACTYFAPPDNPEHPVEVRLVPTYYYDARYSALTLRKGARLARLDDVTSYTRSRPRQMPRARAQIKEDLESLIGKKEDARREELVARLLNDFQASPLQTTAALFDARRPKQADVLNASAAVSLDGWLVWWHTHRLLAAHAQPAALMLLAEAVRKAHAQKWPFNHDQPQNLLPDIPWECLVLLSHALLRNRQSALIPVDENSDRRLIVSWMQEVPDVNQPGTTHYRPMEPRLPESPAVRKLIVQCIEVAESWQPGFLRMMLQGSHSHSVPLGHLMTAVAGGNIPLGYFGRFNPGDLLAEFKRCRAREARGLLPALVRLSHAAEGAAQYGLDRLQLYDQVKHDLAKIFLWMGDAHGSQIHQLLDEILRGQHPQRPTGKE